MKRGDIVGVSAPGGYGKPRPAVIIQATALTEKDIVSVIVCLISRTMVRAPLFRLTLKPDKDNGLEKKSQIMADKIVTVKHAKIQQTIGQLSEEQLTQLNRTLAFVPGIAY